LTSWTKKRNFQLRMITGYLIA